MTRPINNSMGGAVPRPGPFSLSAGRGRTRQPATLGDMDDVERLRTYLQGWDDALACQAETFSWVPDEQLVYVIRQQAARRQAER